MTTRTKVNYESPITEVIELLTEKVICASEQVSSTRQNYESEQW